MKYLIVLLGALMLSGCQTIQTKPSGLSNYDFPNQVPKSILQSLSPGLFYMGLWTRQDSYEWSDRITHKIMTNSDLQFLDDVGFKSVRAMFSLEPILFPECSGMGDGEFPRLCAEEKVANGRFSEISAVGVSFNWRAEKAYKQLLAEIRRMVKNSEQYIVIVPSGRQRHKSLNGQNWGEGTTILSLEMMKQTKDADAVFLKLWEMLAEDLKDISNDRLGMELYNEPEFCYSGGRTIKTGIWKEVATEAVDTIRSITPDRTVFVSGICKGLSLEVKQGAWRYPIADIPLDRPNIVYVFHTYDSNYDQNKKIFKNGETKKFRSPTYNYLAQLPRGVARIDSWRTQHKVPVWINEFGAHVPASDYPYFEEAVNVRSEWANDVVSIFEKYKMPYSWSKFGLQRRIYLNLYKRYGLELDRNPDCKLLKALRVSCAPPYLAK